MLSNPNYYWNFACYKQRELSKHIILINNLGQFFTLIRQNVANIIN